MNRSVICQIGHEALRVQAVAPGVVGRGIRICTDSGTPASS